MIRTSKRSYANVNNLKDYNLTDARLDNPHLPARELPRIVRDHARGIQGLPPAYNHSHPAPLARRVYERRLAS